MSRALVDTITVQRATVEVGAAGTPAETWADLVTLRAERLQHSTEEHLRAAGAAGETVAVFRVRHVDGLTTADRIVFEGSEPEDDWTDEAVWHAVNPGLAHGYPDLAAFRDKAAKAAHSPFERDSFQQFNLNRWLDQSTSPFVEMHVFDEGAHAVDLEDLEARQSPCWLGVDLSKNEDLTVVVACWRDGDGYQVHPWFFCPADQLRARGERHGVDYVEWARAGFIIPTPGNIVDLRAVEEHIRELCATFGVGRLEAMHRAARRGYAEGGHVSGGASARAAESGEPGGSTRIVNAIDAPSFLEEAMRSRAGEKVILNFIRANPSAVRAALGVRA